MSVFGVVQRFVCAKLGHEIYMNLLGGCGDVSVKTVRLVNRSPYGQKQSGRQWSGILVDTVVEYCMGQCKTDALVFHAVEGRQMET